MSERSALVTADHAEAAALTRSWVRADRMLEPRAGTARGQNVEPQKWFRADDPIRLALRLLRCQRLPVRVKPFDLRGKAGLDVVPLVLQGRGEQAIIGGPGVGGPPHRPRRRIGGKGLDGLGDPPAQK